MICDYLKYINITTVEKLLKIGFFNESLEIWYKMKSTPLGRGFLSQFIYFKEFTGSFESGRLPAYFSYLLCSLVIRYQYQSNILLSNGFFSFLIEVMITTLRYSSDMYGL